MFGVLSRNTYRSCRLLMKFTTAQTALHTVPLFTPWVSPTALYNAPLARNLSARQNWNILQGFGITNLHLQYSDKFLQLRSHMTQWFLVHSDYIHISEVADDHAPFSFYYGGNVIRSLHKWRLGPVHNYGVSFHVVSYLSYFILFLNYSLLTLSRCDSPLAFFVPFEAHSDLPNSSDRSSTVALVKR